MPAVSVIIPVYNVEKYLRRCLDSVLNQTFTDWEAICVNDGSPDNSLAILKEYAKKDSRFKIVDKKNGGVSAARNEGLKRAKGKYIHFFDSDDFIDSDFYQKLFAIAYDNNLDAVCSGFITDNAYAENIIYKKIRFLTTLKQKVFYTFMFTDCFIWRYLFKKDFLIKNDLFFDTGFAAQEDTVFLISVFEKANTIAIVPDTFYHYMFNEASILNNKNKEHHKLVKQNYYKVKKLKIEFARRNKLFFLWKIRKLIALFKRSL